MHCHPACPLLAESCLLPALHCLSHELQVLLHSSWKNMLAQLNNTGGLSVPPLDYYQMGRFMHQSQVFTGVEQLEQLSNKVDGLRCQLCTGLSHV